MRVESLLRKLLATPHLTGIPMALMGVAALLLPTLFRGSIDAMVHGLAFIPYVPFVALSALLLDWRVATLVAAVSALLGDYFFAGQANQLFESPHDFFGTVIFGLVSTLVIGMARALRAIATDPLWPHGPDEASKGVIFSAQGGQALVSWNGHRSFVPLGPEADVAEMMQDFLAQRELGKRLAKRQ